MIIQIYEENDRRMWVSRYNSVWWSLPPPDDLNAWSSYLKIPCLPLVSWETDSERFAQGAYWRTKGAGLGEKRSWGVESGEALELRWLFRDVPVWGKGAKPSHPPLTRPCICSRSPGKGPRLWVRQLASWGQLKEQSSAEAASGAQPPGAPESWRGNSLP